MLDYSGGRLQEHRLIYKAKIWKLRLHNTAKVKISKQSKVDTDSMSMWIQTSNKNPKEMIN